MKQLPVGPSPIDRARFSTREVGTILAKALLSGLQQIPNNRASIAIEDDEIAFLVDDYVEKTLPLEDFVEEVLASLPSLP